MRAKLASTGYDPAASELGEGLSKRVNSAS